MIGILKFIFLETFSFFGKVENSSNYRKTKILVNHSNSNDENKPNDKSDDEITTNIENNITKTTSTKKRDVEKYKTNKNKESSDNKCNDERQQQPILCGTLRLLRK